MIEFRIARRYLWAARKQAHTAFLSSISVLGLALGVAVLLFVLALLAGLQGQIKARLISSTALSRFSFSNSAMDNQTLCLA